MSSQLFAEASGGDVARVRAAGRSLTVAMALLTLILVAACGNPTHDLTFLEFRLQGFLGLAAFDGEEHIVWYFEGPDEE